MQKVTVEDLALEYERGKRHGEDDRRMIEQQNREQALEIQQWKSEVAALKMERARKRVDADKVAVLLEANDVPADMIPYLAVQICTHIESGELLQS